jgi:hypothetical protein
MNDTRPTQPQDLREAFASLISMMLGLLRAHGLRGLIHLPAMWLAAREIRRIGAEVIALYDAWQAGTLPSQAPAPCTDRQAAPAQPAAALCVPARLAVRSSHARTAAACPAPGRRPSLPARRNPCTRNRRATNRRATNRRAVRFARAYRILGSQDRPDSLADILVSARST